MIWALRSAKDTVPSNQPMAKTSFLLYEKGVGTAIWTNLCGFRNLRLRGANGSIKGMQLTVTSWPHNADVSCLTLFPTFNGRSTLQNVVLNKVLWTRLFGPRQSAVGSGTKPNRYSADLKAQVHFGWSRYSRNCITDDEAALLQHVPMVDNGPKRCADLVNQLVARVSCRPSVSISGRTMKWKLLWVHSSTNPNPIQEKTQQIFSEAGG